MCRIVLSDNTLDLYILPSALVCMILTLYDFRTCPAQENAGAIDMSMCVCICDRPTMHGDELETQHVSLTITLLHYTTVGIFLDLAC